jgi:ketosteroid isomerase-like protein
MGQWRRCARRYSVQVRLSVAVLFCAVLCRADDASDIRAIRVRSNNALAEHNIEAFVESLSPDFVMVRGNGTLVSSRKEYIELLATDFKNAKAVRYERITDKVEVSSAAPLAAEHGHWIAILPNGGHAYGGTYLAMWRRNGTRWEIRSELFVWLSCDDPASCDGYKKE